MKKRKKTKIIKIGGIAIGGNNAIAIQSMLKTPLLQYKKVLREVFQLKKAGCEILRVAFKRKEEENALKSLLSDSPLPVEVDIHFDHRLALKAIDLGAPAIRINPGNIRDKKALKTIVKKAKENGSIIRVGANVGCLPSITEGIKRTEALITLISNTVSYLESLEFYNIILSAKSDSVVETYFVNMELSKRFAYPLHIGVTATGFGENAIIKSALGIGALLLQGIGDTIRVSLTASSLKEVKVAKTILSSLGLRQFEAEIISCPMCGRAEVDVNKLVRELKSALKNLSPKIKATTRIAIMGCEVNGPGEARFADFGIAGGKAKVAVFSSGRIVKIVEEKDAIKELIQLISEHYALV